MDSKNQALRPALYSIPSFEKKEEQLTEEQVLNKDEQILAEGAETQFWKTLKKHVNTAIQELEEVNSQAVISGAPLDEIGKNTIVITMTKGVLKRIFNKVEDAHELREQGNGKE